ncbi:MAG: hypothetical protein HZA51_08665 [Planctomycetes bacterium]|nr:hypothetical protein [Planctomycetota bacterium]
MWSEGLSAYVNQGGRNCYNYFPSVAITGGGSVSSAWVGHRIGEGFGPVYSGETLVQLDAFQINSDPATWPRKLPDPNNHVHGDWIPSVGVNVTPPLLQSTAWTSMGQNGATKGVVHDPFQGSGSLESCPYYCDWRIDQWSPCMSARDDGIHALVWSHVESEYEGVEAPPRDIVMQLFDANGNPLGQTITINERDIEGPLSIQSSPSVSFVGDQIVVTWFGPGLKGFPVSPHIFARRFTWPGGNASPTPLGRTITVDSSSSFTPYETGSDDANPAVALSQTGNGRWIVVWTARPTDANKGTEIHGQYFDGALRMGTEFRVNQDTTQLGFDAPNIVHRNTLQRRLANSGQHTVAFGSMGVVCAWTSHDEPIYFSPQPMGLFNNNRVFFTVLPPGFDDYQDELTACCKGDMNYNGTVEMTDLQDFIDVLLGGEGDPGYTPEENFCRADMNGDGVLDANYDVYFFIESVWNLAQCQNLAYRLNPYDCNINAIDDRLEIAENTDLDCNGNGFLDSCETNPNLHTFGYGAPDCNANGIPDECDLKQGPPDGSLDCNDNGIPDECDVANQTSPDCNQNGIPDSCDIASGHSPDRFPRDGIPDECAILEDGPMMTLEGDLICEPAIDVDAAWAELRLWAAQQQWGPDAGISGAAQYQRYVDKLCELGLIDLTP